MGVVSKAPLGQDEVLAPDSRDHRGVLRHAQQH